MRFARNRCGPHVSKWSGHWPLLRKLRKASSRRCLLYKVLVCVHELKWRQLLRRPTRWKISNFWPMKSDWSHAKICITGFQAVAPTTNYCNERAADGALCSGEGRRTTKERSSDASETERLLNVKPEVILGSLTAGYVISDDCQTSRLHNAGTTPNLGAPLDTNQHNYETQQLTRRDRHDFVTLRKNVQISFAEARIKLKWIFRWTLLAQPMKAGRCSKWRKWRPRKNRPCHGFQPPFCWVGKEI